MRVYTPFTLFRYLAAEFLKWLGVVAGSLFTLVFIFDLIELVRRTSARPNIKFGTLLGMTFLKVPQVVLQLLPFIILLTSLILFWRLTRHKEVLVMRMAGVSLWQMLSPLVGVVLLVKVADLAFLNPFAAVFYNEFERLENQRIYGREENFTISETGVWIRQADRHGQFILRAAQVDNRTLKEVAIFEFDKQERLLRRLDAAEAMFKPGELALIDVVSILPEGQQEIFDKYIFYSELTFDRLQERGAHPKTMSFWRLPEFIRLLDKSGLSSHKYRLYWHSLIANIFLVVSMLFVGAGCAFSHVGRSRNLYLIALGLSLGFGVFFVTDITYALGLAMSIPLLMAAWAPACLGMLLGMTIIFHLEDG